MFSYLLGLVLVGLGLRQSVIAPNVLGDETTASANTLVPRLPLSALPLGNARSGSVAAVSLSGVKVLHPVLTLEQEKTFQKDRKAREANIKAVSDARTKGLDKKFTDVMTWREHYDEASRTAFIAKVNTFRDATKKQKILSLADNFHTVVTKALTTVQKRLESMLTLLDKISVSAAALKAQGKDVSKVDADIPAAQAKVTSALALVQSLTPTLPLSLPIPSEGSAGSQIKDEIGATRSQLLPIYTAFTDARKAVGIALTDLESLTKATEVTPTP